MENKELPQPKYVFNYLVTNKKRQEKKNIKKKEYLDDLLDQKFLNDYFNKFHRKQ